MAKREHFKFYRSYYDVFCELKNDKEKLAFIDAIFQKQFYNADTELHGMANFAYISQRHSIDAQVQGFIDQKGEIDPPTQGGIKGGMVPPSVQYTIDNEQQVISNKQHTIGNDCFDSFWELYPRKSKKKDAESKYKKLTKQHDDIIQGLQKWCDYWEDEHTEEQYIPHPSTWLNQERWEEDPPKRPVYGVFI